MADNKLPQIVNPDTGEIIPIGKVKPEHIKGFLKTLKPEQVSTLLTDVNFFRRFIEKVEKGTKEYVLKDLQPPFDEEGVCFWEDWRIRMSGARRFSEKKLLEEGTEIEKKQWLKLKEKYSTFSQYPKFG